MIKRWKAELNQLIILTLIGGFCGWAIGYPGWGVALVLVFYCYWLLLRLRDLVEWVEKDDLSDAPESTGVWGELFDNLNQQKKRAHAAKVSLEEIITRAQASLDAIEEAVVVTNNQGIILWFNKAAVRLLGLKPSIDQHNHLTNLVRHPKFVRFFKRGKFNKPIKLPSPNSAQTLLQITVTVFGENNDRLLIGRDITRINNLEEMRKDFVANVSHELRTPLTVIKGYLETFLGAVDPNQKALYRGLEQMNQQAHRMELLVTDLLLLSKLETEGDHKTISAINVPAVLKQVHNDAIAINDEKQHQIHLEVDDSLYLMGVENELRSAFSNLVTNAVKYTPANGEITIRWWRDKDGAHMSVKDTGIGIDSRHIPRLTERFYRADASRHSKTGGTGLGLAIVKHVLIHHDGRLEIKSELNKGSEFICHFPARHIICQEPNGDTQSVA